MVHVSENRETFVWALPWRIRNVAEPAAELPQNVRSLAPDLAERMEALVRRVAAHRNEDGTVNLYEIRATVDEACSLVAEMPPVPVDPDLIEARKLVANRTGRLQIECGYSHRVLDGEEDDHPAVINALAAIKRGRELERGE